MWVLEHAFGERYDSPVPLTLFVLGGAFVVLLSFLLVYRRDVATSDQVPDVDAIVPPRAGPAADLASVAVLASLVIAGLIGAQEVPENILPTAFWLVAWVAVPLIVGIVGDFTGLANPFAAIARWADNDRARFALIRSGPVAWPARAGFWVSTALYLLVVIGELIVNQTATLPRVTAVGLAAYALVCAAGGLVFGADAWNTRAEMFSVLYSTWGRLGWYRFRAPGRRGFAGGLAAPFETSPSRLVGVLLLLVSVSFDGLLSTPQWTRFTDALPGDLGPGTRGLELVATLTLVLLTAVMISVFGGFAVAAARAGGHGERALTALTGLLPSLLPIAYGYLLAHYLQYVLINGQLLFPLLGDPLGSGSSWLPYPFNDGYEVNTTIMPTSVVWYLQIGIIVGAHILAVVLAHRHLTTASVAPALARRSEWPWLVAMVGYTMLSLWLLAQPLIEQKPAPGAAWLQHLLQPVI